MQQRQLQGISASLNLQPPDPLAVNTGIVAQELFEAWQAIGAVYNGMASGADWMSAASFIGMAGTLYLSGYGGLAYILGWTGGFCLVALLIAPYLRKFGQYTIPDFMGARYGGNAARMVAVKTTTPP